MIVSVLTIFVCFSIICCCFLAGIVCWDLNERKHLAVALSDARDAMVELADSLNVKDQANSQVIADLQERVQSHDLRLSGGITKSATIRQ